MICKKHLRQIVITRFGGGIFVRVCRSLIAFMQHQIAAAVLRLFYRLKCGLSSHGAAFILAIHKGIHEQR